VTSEPEQTIDQTPGADPEEGPKKPSLIKQVLPWVLTAAIFYWIFSKVDFIEVWNQMKMANLWVLMPAMVVLAAVQVGLEVWTFGLGYKWFGDRHPTYWQVAVARLAAFPTQALFAPLAAFQLLAYLVKVYKMKLSRALAADLFTLYPDQVFGLINFIVAVILVHATGGDPLHWAIYAISAASLILWPAWFIYWMTGLKDRLWPRLRDVGIFYSWKQATWGQVGKMFLMRMPMGIAVLGSQYACLYAFGIEVPLITFIIAVPIIMAAVFSPAQVGGYGGPQAVAILFYGDYASNEIIVAQSLLWSSLFSLFRILAGTGFVYPAIKGFQNPDAIDVPAAPDMEEEEDAVAEVEEL
jgi:hypothetical protein